MAEGTVPVTVTENGVKKVIGEAYLNEDGTAAITIIHDPKYREMLMSPGTEYSIGE